MRDSEAPAAICKRELSVVVQAGCSLKGPVAVGEDGATSAKAQDGKELDKTSNLGAEELRWTVSGERRIGRDRQSGIDRRPASHHFRLSEMKAMPAGKYARARHFIYQGIFWSIGVVCKGLSDQP